MEYTTYASRLRYLGADDVDDAVVDYDGLDVIGTDGQKLGHVDGFIVDGDARRVFYVVVDSGGWFRSRQFLLPIGHATLEPDRRAVRVDVARESISSYPEFDSDRFRQFSDDDLRRFETAMGLACCPDENRDTAAQTWAYDTNRHYRQPEWWRGTARGAAASTAAAADSLRDERHGEKDVDRVREREIHEDPERELVTARDRDNEVSPHFEGRAQPGDVLGIETGGERTGIGDTAEEEDKRRRAAERSVPRDPEDRSER